MEFNEKNIQTIRDLSLGYFMITTVSVNTKISKSDQSNIISEFLKTKYFVWNYENEPHGQNVILTDENGKISEYFNEKFFGFYETKKLEHSDFKEIAFESFESNIKNKVLQETNFDFLNNCLKILKSINSKSDFYILNPSENKIPQFVKDFPIYTFFHSYLNIDDENCEIKLIEFGLD